MDLILESLSDFATNLKFSALPANAVAVGKERMLDAIGCALGAFDLCHTFRVRLLGIFEKPLS